MVLFDLSPLPLHHHAFAHQYENNSPTFDATEDSSKKDRCRTRRRVSFARTSCVIEEATPWTEEEKRNSFYTKKERRAFGQDRINVCRMFETKYMNGEQWKETDEVTLRGLEDFFGEYSKEQIRKMHVAKVLKEQRRQVLLCEPMDYHTIRYVSCESSGMGRVKAIHIGNQDAIAAKRAS
eukprot:CAMPEP_0168751088 /NCGR_PEP_ID=MMETSP0724-20121128/17633_1 /TAXON_ID=265536 /ORGANISM="Amphiprora sp., Strain CCMP467" /LENGTH=179 /DNA_ID=CAMNT_0008799181 /DNA_START=80 /DNA_END=619 /DNA_ORIENTATION=+